MSHTDLLDMLRLPPHVHATVLTGTDMLTGQPLARPVVWADRISVTCPRCGEDVGLETDCPVTLETGTPPDYPVRQYDQRHVCGEDLLPLWREVDTDLGELTTQEAAQSIEAAAAELAGERDRDLAAEYGRIRRGLERDLRRALRHLGEPLDGDTPHERVAAVTTGSDMSPGVYLDVDRWVAWDYQPDTTIGEPIEVSAAAVSYAQAAAMLGVSRARVGVLANEGKLDRADGGGVSVASVLTRARRS